LPEKEYFESLHFWHQVERILTGFQPDFNVDLPFRSKSGQILLSNFDEWVFTDSNPSIFRRRFWLSPASGRNHGLDFDVDFRWRKESTGFRCLKLIRIWSIDLVDIAKVLVGGNPVEIRKNFDQIWSFGISFYKINVLSRAKIHAQNEHFISCSIITHLIPMTL